MSTKDLGHWQYSNDFDITEWYGFVYRIIEVDTNKEYIGKKNFWSSNQNKTKQRNKIVKESNWKTYTSSSKYLNEQIELKGIQNYQFYIVSLHTTEGCLSYAEIELQVKEDVLRAVLPNGDDKYYNRSIAGMKFKPTEHTPEQRKKISETRKKKGLGVGSNNPMFGKHHTDEAKQKIGSRDYSSITGSNNYMFGKTHSEEAKKRIGQSSKGRNVGKKHTKEVIDKQRTVKKSNNTSGVIGVTYISNTKLWRTIFGVNNTTITLGHFKNKEQAVQIRKEAEQYYKQHHDITQFVINLNLKKQNQPHANTRKWMTPNGLFDSIEQVCEFYKKTKETIRANHRKNPTQWYSIKPH